MPETHNEELKFEQELLLEDHEVVYHMKEKQHRTEGYILAILWFVSLVVCCIVTYVLAVREHPLGTFEAGYRTDFGKISQNLL